MLRRALFFALVIFAVPLVRADGAATRKSWVEFAERLATPILAPMAEGRLHKELSVATGTLELAPHWGRRDARVAYLAAFLRLMAGIAPWLALPDDGSDEAAVRARLRSLALKCYANAVDPENADNLHIELGGQTLVDAAFLAESFLRAWDALWVPLDETTKGRYVAAFTSLRRHVPPYQNWVLFCSLEEAFLLRAGAEIDGYRLRTGLYKTEEWYVGDGWYADGPGFSFDYYNAFVIQPMYFECLDELVRAKRWLVPYAAASRSRRTDAPTSTPSLFIGSSSERAMLRECRHEGAGPSWRKKCYNMPQLNYNGRQGKGWAPARDESAAEATRRGRKGRGGRRHMRKA